MSFLKSRRKAPASGVLPASTVDAALSDHTMEPGRPTEPAVKPVDETGIYNYVPGLNKGRVPSEKAGGVHGDPTVTIKPPNDWLHMDVLERDKLEWTTDVLPTPPKPELDGTETRFSFSGLVIPRRATTIPSHMGLHHHGDEPQVRHA